MNDTTPPPLVPPDPAASTATSTGLERNIAAGLACLFTIVGGAIFLILERKDQFVRFWAMQAALLGGSVIVFQILLHIVGFVFGFVPLVGKLMLVVLWIGNLVVGIGWFVIYVTTVLKAFSGTAWDIPLLGGIARQLLAKLDRTETPPAA